MKNPLYKRLPRELKSDMGKYIALFLFLTLTIGFCSGFLVSNDSTKKAYNQSFEKYNIEDGHFTLSAEADYAGIELLENEGVSIYPLFYKDKELESEHTIRMYQVRDQVNKVDLMAGAMPVTDKELVIDRLYAENNKILIGDTVAVDDIDFTVCGYVALSDYSALFKNNTDMMFDAHKFSVALVTDTAFDKLNNAGLHYTYAWINDTKTLTDVEKREKADDLTKIISATGSLTDFVERDNNQAIMFTGDDMGSDKVMIQWLLYIVIVVLGFAFAVTTRNTIEQESSVIGTLRASGYTRRELICHYLALPLLVTLVAAVIGNVIGYTFMKDFVSSLMYHSYSLTTYVTLWNAEAFVLTTLIPCFIILVINIVVLYKALRLPPLQFLRHDLKKRTKKKVMKLKHGKFFIRFHIRVIFQNISSYLIMFIGIFMGSVLLMFGMMFTPMLKNFKTEVVNSEIANYQYILKSPLETETSGAEKYSVTALENDSDEEITIYGIEENSIYLKKLNFIENGVILSDGYMDKYGLEIGDTVTLTEKYANKEHTFKVKDSYHYPATLCVFMSRADFNTTFNLTEENFTGYFSDQKISDIDMTYIATIITQDDLTVMANQLDDSMGMVFYMFSGFAILLYMIIIYLLAKLIIEKNTHSISMIKILGYSDNEIGRLYNNSTAIVVALSLLISILISSVAIKAIFYQMMLGYPGWLTYYIAPWIYPVVVVMGAICYTIVHLIEMKKIRHIPLSNALKNME